jgi:hypothetical protein
MENKNSLAHFFTNPIVGIVGSVTSIISLILAVYIWQGEKITPKLTYLINPARAVVVKANQASGLSVSFNNKDIKTDITAAQIAVWNEGKKVIKSENILKPIIIRTGNNSAILEATIIKSSRDVIKVNLDKSQLQDGIIKVSWNLLELGDGAVIQLIYQGNPDVNISVDGIIEGQRTIKRIITNQLKSSDETGLATNNKKLGFIILGAGGVLSVLVMILAFYTKKSGKFTWPADLVIIAAPLILLGIGSYFIFIEQKLGPPFGF